MLLSDLIAPARRLAVVGLAKNTGKTETLGAILRELDGLGRTTGVTSIGRDGEARDAIDGRIEKPRVRLPAGSLVATTDALLRASAVPYRLVRATDIRTPLGRVLVARMEQAGAVEIAGPSAAQEVRAVADLMLESGAEQVLLDGAIDRRAAASPAVSDGLVICTGAVLHEDIDVVVERTRSAVELACLPRLENECVRALARSKPAESLLSDSRGRDSAALPPRFALAGSAQGVAMLLRDRPSMDHLIVRGAVSEAFLQELLPTARTRSLTLVVDDSTKVFLGERGCAWYLRRGLSLRVLRATQLRVVTVNPVAPRSHSFDSFHLRSELASALQGVPVLDVRHLARRMFPSRADLPLSS